MIIHILTLGLIFSLLSLGVHLSFKHLNFPDMTVDGSFPLGASLCSVLMLLNAPPVFALLVSLIGGALSGGVTALLHTKLKLSELLSGILTMIALYSVNLRIMGRPNTPLMGLSHPFKDDTALLSAFLLVLFIKLLLDYFYKSKMGMILKASGENPDFVRSLGLSPDFYKGLGLMIANALVALSGAVMALYQGFADVGMGLGMMVAGLAAVITFQNHKGTLPIILGSILYRAVVRIAFALGVAPGDIKLLTAVILLLLLSPVIQRALSLDKLLSPLRHTLNISKRRRSHAHLPKPN